MGGDRIIGCVVAGIAMAMVAMVWMILAGQGLFKPLDLISRRASAWRRARVVIEHLVYGLVPWLGAQAVERSLDNNCPKKPDRHRSPRSTE